MKLLYFLLFALLLSACNSSPSNSYQRSEHSKIAEKITERTAQKIEAETGLLLCGIGGGMMDQVNMMAMSFDYRGELTMEQGRELLVYCVSEYLEAINADIKIRPYLAHYPFTPKDIEIRIFVRKPNNESVSTGALSLVSEINGILEYDIREPFPEVLRTVHEELYEEAVKVLETEGPVNKVRKNLSHI